MADRKHELFEAVVQNPNDAELSAELESLLREERDWAGLVQLFTLLAEKSEEPRAAAAYLRSAAEVSEAQLDDPRHAVELLNASLQSDETQLVATLSKMRALLTRMEEWDNLIEVSQYQAAQLTDPAELSALYQEIAQIYEEKVGDLEQAVGYYKAAFDTDQRAVDALVSAREIFKEYQNWEWVVQFLDMELQVTEESARRFELMKEMGLILQHHLQQDETARQCYEECLRIHPEDEQLRSALLSVGGTPPALKAPSAPPVKASVPAPSAPPVVVSAPVPSAPVPSAPPVVASAPVPSAPPVVASAPVPSAPVPSAPPVVASAPVPSAPVPSAPPVVASAPVPSAPPVVPSAPVPSAP
ncbi:hypothetical protein KKF91_16725, partial [Myxococcota bacterium]|nr:hypothetical protein [Myxococcota bacterium]